MQDKLLQHKVWMLRLSSRKRLPWEPKPRRECEARCVTSWSDAIVAQGRCWSGNRPKGLVTGYLIFMVFSAQKCGLGLLRDRKMIWDTSTELKHSQGCSLSKMGLETVCPPMEVIWNISLSLKNQRPRLVTCFGGIQICICSSSPGIFNPRKNIKR